MVQNFATYFNNSPHVFLDQLCLNDINNASFSGLIQIMLGPINFLLNARLHLLNVHRSTVFCQEFLALQLK
jgi:hypothetical protein